MTMTWPNQGAAVNGLSAVRSSIAGVRERTVRSTAAPEAVAELGRSPKSDRLLVMRIAAIALLVLALCGCGRGVITHWEDGNLSSLYTSSLSGDYHGALYGGMEPSD